MNLQMGVCYSCDTVAEYEFKDYAALTPCGACGDSYIFLYYAQHGLIQLTPNR